MVLEADGEADGAALLSGSAVRSHTRTDDGEEAAIKGAAAWGSFDVDVLGKPAVGVDALASWWSVAFFWATFPLHIALGVLAGLVPWLGRRVVGLQIRYCQSGAGGGPEGRNPLLVPGQVCGLFASAFNMFAKAHSTAWHSMTRVGPGAAPYAALRCARQGGRQALRAVGPARHAAAGWRLVLLLRGVLPPAVRRRPLHLRVRAGALEHGTRALPAKGCALPTLPTGSAPRPAAQVRGRWLGATVAMCPEAVPTNLLLFLDGAHHRAVRSAAVAHLLSPATYKPRAAALGRVLEPLLPARRGLATFVGADGKVDTELCARLVARALWFLCFGDAGLLDGDELEVVAAWNSVPRVLFMPRFLNRILFGLLARKAAAARRAVLQAPHLLLLARLLLHPPPARPCSHLVPPLLT